MNKTIKEQNKSNPYNNKTLYINKETHNFFFEKRKNKSEARTYFSNERKQTIKVTIIHPLKQNNRSSSQRFYVCHHEIGDDDTNNYSVDKESKEAHTSSGEASWLVLKSNETRVEREISEIEIHGFGKIILRYEIRERRSLLFI